MASKTLKSQQIHRLNNWSNKLIIFRGRFVPKTNIEANHPQKTLGSYETSRQSREGEMKAWMETAAKRTQEGCKTTKHKHLLIKN